MNNNKENYTDKLYRSLSFGDCIFAKRYDNNALKNKLGNNHQTGPYIIVGTDENDVYGVFCTSKEQSEDFIQLAENYRLFNDKNTYINTSRIEKIDRNRFLGKIKENLDEEDKKRLKKKLYFQKYSFYKDTPTMKSINKSIESVYEVFDVVSFKNNRYLIIDINDETYTLLKINNYNARYSTVDFNVVLIDYDNVITTNETPDYYINTICEEAQSLVMDYYKSRSSKIIHSKKIYENNQKKNNNIINIRNNKHFNKSIKISNK